MSDHETLQDLCNRFKEIAKAAAPGVMRGPDYIVNQFERSVAELVFAVGDAVAGRESWVRPGVEVYEATFTFDELFERGLIDEALHRKAKEILECIVAIVSLLAADAANDNAS